MMRFRKPAAVINARAGSTSDISGEIETRLRSYSDDMGPVVYAEPEKLMSTVDGALDEGCDLIVVYGGDGTICSVARQASARDVPIIALPGGTMNLFPKALYDTVEWQDALETALSCDEPRWAAAGQINDDIFLCACLLGTPTSLNEVREQLRKRKLFEAVEDFVFNAMNFDAKDALTYSLGRKSGVSRRANLLAVSCPLRSNPETGRGAFEVNSINIGTLLDVASLGLSALASDWRENQSAATNLSDTVHIEGAQPIDLLLDGEPRQVAAPFTITFKRKGVCVLAP